MESIEAKLPDTEPSGKLEESSPTWLYILEWAQGELEKARENNDRSSLGEVQTALNRGDIRRLKSLIDLPNKEKGIDLAEEATYSSVPAFHKRNRFATY